VVPGLGVRVSIVLIGRVGVHDRLGEPRKLVQELVVGPLGDLVGFSYTELAIDHQPYLGVKLVSDPSDAHVTDADDAIDMSQDVFGFTQESRVHGVHQPLADTAGCPCQHEEYEEADQEADHRIGPARALSLIHI